MKKISYPAIDTENVYLTCLESIPDDKQAYHNKMEGIAPLVESEWNTYLARKDRPELHLFSSARHGYEDDLILGSVSKKELVTLYTSYMLKKGSDARDVYDRLRASSNGICPLCGIGSVTTLDHYLPKARYPIFSVMPENLVPSCSDCNKGKGSSIYTNEDDQCLHPYYSNNIFYTETWIMANLQRTIPLTFDFYASPPPHWSELDRKRAIKHFEEFKIKDKYSTYAATLLTMLESSARLLLTSMSPETVQEHFREIARQEKANTTTQAVYFAVAEDIRFCSGEF